MTNIAQVAVGVINLIEDGRFIYSIAANAMDVVEALKLFGDTSLFVNDGTCDFVKLQKKVV